MTGGKRIPAMICGDQSWFWRRRHEVQVHHLKSEAGDPLH